MPCYLFTYHAYRSWMPDRPEGFVQRHRGVLPPDEELAKQYRSNASQPPVTFGPDIQRVLIDEVQVASGFQKFRTHFVATEPTHVHVLVSWPDDRPWQKVRNGLKSSLTRRLNRQVRRQWFVDGASRKRVRTQKHFDHLVIQYLPAHGGWKWREGAGEFK